MLLILTYISKRTSSQQPTTGFTSNTHPTTLSAVHHRRLQKKKYQQVSSDCCTGALRQTFKEVEFCKQPLHHSLCAPDVVVMQMEDFGRLSTQARRER